MSRTDSRFSARGLPPMSVSDGDRGEVEAETEFGEAVDARLDVRTR